jgi:hypothetical protein
MRKAAATLGLLLLFLIPGVAHAENEPHALTVLTGRIVFDKSAPDFEATQEIAINVSGSQPAIVRMYFEDKVVTTEGATITLPFGSTPTSLEGVAEISPETIEYTPSDSGTQQFTVRVTVDPEKLVAPLQGEFMVTLTPTTPIDSEGLAFGSALAIGYTAVAVPQLGDQSLYSLGIRNESFRITSHERQSFLDRVIPDLPRVISSGPVNMEHRSQNIGDVPLDKRAMFEIYRVSFSSLFGGEANPYYTIQGEPKIVLAGANFSSSYSTVIDVENGPNIDALPFIGLVKFEVTSEGQISGIDVEAENGPIVRYYLVFPWKWALVLLIPVVAYGFVVVRRQRQSSTDDESMTPQPTTPRTKMLQLRRKPTVDSRD